MTKRKIYYKSYAADKKCFYSLPHFKQEFGEITEIGMNNNLSEKGESWMKKSVNSCKVIGGADGPVSVFVLGRENGQNLCTQIKRVFMQHRYQRRRKKAIRKITANPHTLDEVVSYIIGKYNAVEVSAESRRYAEQRKNCKASLVQKFNPELLGESWVVDRPDVSDEKSVREFLERVDSLQEKAASISEELFWMDYHLYHFNYKEYGEVYVEIEKNHEFISTSSSAHKGKIKLVNRAVNDIYLYYGVSEEDIAEKTERYNELVTVLASW